MVKTVAEAVARLVEGDLSLQDALQRGYANYSAVARMVKGKVEETLKTEVNLEAIVSSVKRTRMNYKEPWRDVAYVVAGSFITLRTDVAKITVEKTKRNLEAIRTMLIRFVGDFFQILEGISAITLVFDRKISDEVVSMFRRVNILDERRDLAAVILHSKIEIIDAPGCVAAFYNSLSRRHINIEETMSCFTDTIIVVHMKDVGEAFTALSELISTAREISGS
ncbi:MAG: hypothetical protein GTN80_01815 [Nitrososphaeria archaeon]|nr:hypothetical protein [Nitrososphaeria archaeon]NIN51852.1 hypothetical protein [Nitrososphaeria archaeon]NIQ32374.1 hypothetical protein [Nitrososphaeria archaeon]